MLTNVREYSLFAPGCLVMCSKALYFLSPIDGNAGSENRVSYGTVGVIIQGPSDKHPAQYQVQFLNNVTTWVSNGEIEPYFE